MTDKLPAFSYGNLASFVTGPWCDEYAAWLAQGRTHTASIPYIRALGI